MLPPSILVNKHMLGLHLSLLDFELDGCWLCVVVDMFGLVPQSSPIVFS